MGADISPLPPARGTQIPLSPPKPSATLTTSTPTHRGQHEPCSTRPNVYLRRADACPRQWPTVNNRRLSFHFLAWFFLRREKRETNRPTGTRAHTTRRNGLVPGDAPHHPASARPPHPRRLLRRPALELPFLEARSSLLGLGPLSPDSNLHKTSGSRDRDTARKSRQQQWRASSLPLSRGTCPRTRRQQHPRLLPEPPPRNPRPPRAGRRPSPARQRAGGASIRATSRR